MSAYYNEFDPKAAAWLRELIAEGCIAPGYVDERSILDVRPHELTPYVQQHFFAGIGGWSYALRLAGISDETPIRTGSCPCQPFSIAGQGLGTKDERHLWPSFRDLITFGEPSITFGEQVASPDGREWLAGVRADLEGLGYEVGAADLCAAGVGSPHPRQRLYWMANPNNKGPQGRRRRELRERASECALGSRRDPSSRGVVQSNGAGRHEGRQGAEADGHGRSGRGVASDDSRPCDRCKSRGWYLARFSDNHATPCADCCGVGFIRLGDADRARGIRTTNSRPIEAQRGRDSDASPWSDFDVLRFRDLDKRGNQKLRRVEAGTFPLAHGVSGRVGLLRGYGNAIVPQVAALFIQASLEALPRIDA